MTNKDGDKPDIDEEAEAPVESLLADDDGDEDEGGEKGNLFVAEDASDVSEPDTQVRDAKTEVPKSKTRPAKAKGSDRSKKVPVTKSAEVAKTVKPEVKVAKAKVEAQTKPDDAKTDAAGKMAESKKATAETNKIDAKAESRDTKEKTPDTPTADEKPVVEKVASEKSSVGSAKIDTPENKISSEPDTAPDSAQKPEPKPVVVERIDEPEDSLPDPVVEKTPDTAAALLASAAAHQSADALETEVPEDEHEDHEEYLEGEDLHQSTFLRKLGVSAGLLVAGALVALWLGPKIAPGLPSGMGGVRDWLMPGQSEAQVQIDTLRNDLERQIAVLPRQRTDAEIAAIVAGSVAANRTDYEDRIAALETRVEQLIDIGSRADASGFEQRIAALENRVSGVSAQISSLNDTLGSFESDGSVSETAIAQMAGFTANVEAVRAEVAGLVELTASLEQELTQVRSSAERRVSDAESEIASAQEQAAVAESTANIQSGLSSIEASLRAGSPFNEALAQLQPHADISPALAAVSETGVATLPVLQDGFPQAAHEAIRTSIQAGAEETVLGRMSAFVNSQVANRSLTPQEGMSTDAILSRAEASLREGEIANTKVEIDTMTPDARAAMGDWVAMLDARIAAETAFVALRDQLQTTN